MKAFQIVEIAFELRGLQRRLVIHESAETKRASSVVEIRISQYFWQLLLVRLVDKHLLDALLSVSVGHLLVSGTKVLCRHDSLLLLDLI